jgi:AraC family transcriptional regulator, transcriptional activator of pobA
MKTIPVRRIDAAHKESGLPGGFRIRAVGTMLDGKDMTQDLHRHDFFFVLALIKGKGNHEIDFVANPVEDGSLFVMHPGQVHRLMLKAGSEGYLMEFTKDFYPSNMKSHRELLDQATTNNQCQLIGPGAERIHVVLHTIFQEYSRKEDGYDKIIKASLSIFMVELIRQKKPASSQAKDIDYQQERLQEFLELLQRDISKKKQVSQYTDQLNLSYFQLNSITKTLLGKSAAQVIDDHILLESKRYLLATTNHVNQIAYHLGYEDDAYFIRFFKKHTGQTPETFRKNFR